MIKFLGILVLLVCFSDARQQPRPKPMRGPKGRMEFSHRDSFIVVWPKGCAFAVSKILQHGETQGGDDMQKPGDGMQPGNDGGMKPDGGMQPGRNQTDGMRPDGNHTDGMKPGGMKPGGMQPGGMQPGGMQPGGMQPGGMQPGGMQPGGMQPGGMQPGGMQPGGNQPGGNQPGGNQPGGNRPGGNQTGGNQPGGNQPDGTKPQKMKVSKPMVVSFEGIAEVDSMGNQRMGKGKKKHHYVRDQFLKRQCNISTENGTVPNSGGVEVECIVGKMSLNDEPDSPSVEIKVCLVLTNGTVEQGDEAADVYEDDIKTTVILSRWLTCCNDSTLPCYCEDEGVTQWLDVKTSIQTPKEPKRHEGNRPPPPKKKKVPTATLR